MKVFFDLGGTIMRDKERFWKRAMEKIVSEEIGKKVAIDFYVGDKTMKGMIRRLLIKANVGPEEEIIDAIIEKFCDYYDRNVRREFMELIPKSSEFIKVLSERGFELYLLTGDLKCVALKRLSFFGLDKCFKGGVFGDETYYKPDLIEIAKERFGTGIYFEDRPENIKRARELGFIPIGVETKNTAQELRDAGAEMVIKDYGVLLKLLKTIP